MAKCGRTEILDLAAGTVGVDRRAPRAAVGDEPMTPDRPMLARNDPHEVALNFLGVSVRRQLEPVRQPADVRVHHDALVDAEGVAEHDIRGLAPDARQRAQLLHLLRNLAAVACEDLGTHRPKVARFRPVEAGRVNDGLQLLRRDRRVVGRRATTVEKRGGDDVHPLVGALR